MPSELQIAKNILKGIEQRGFKKIDQTTCKNEDKLLIIDIGSQILKTKENQYW